MVDEGFAKRPRSTLKATVDGKRFKASKRGLIALYATASFSLNASTKLKRKVVRSINVNCGPVNVKTLTLPATVTACYGAYTEAPSHGSLRQWTGIGIDVTVESVEGGRIVGTFGGMLDQASPNTGDPPVTLEGGRFSLVLTDTGV
jgi:hypothetical protein